MERTLEQWKRLLNHLATEYDDKQVKKKSYNPHALGIYFKGIDDALADPKFLENPRKALAQEFLISGETGGIYHRNLPEDFSTVKFSLSFLNSKKLWG